MVPKSETCKDALVQAGLMQVRRSGLMFALFVFGAFGRLQKGRGVGLIGTDAGYSQNFSQPERECLPSIN